MNKKPFHSKPLVNPLFESNHIQDSATTQSSGGQRTKQDILLNALDFFAVNGYNGTSMRMLAKHVGIKPSTLYYYFEGKEAILSALFELLQVDVVQEKLEQEMDDAILDDPLQSMQFYSDWLVVGLEDHHTRYFLQLLITEQFRNETAHRLLKEGIMNRHQPFWRRLFQKWMQEKKIRDDNPNSLTAEFLAALGYFHMGLLFFWDDKSRRNVIQKQIQYHIQFFYNVVRVS